MKHEQIFAILAEIAEQLKTKYRIILSTKASNPIEAKKEKDGIYSIKIDFNKGETRLYLFHAYPKNAEDYTELRIVKLGYFWGQKTLLSIPLDDARIIKLKLFAYFEGKLSPYLEKEKVYKEAA